MRRILPLLLAFPLLWSPSSLFAQSEYYWSNGEKILLTPDYSTLSVYFAEPQMLSGLQARSSSAIIAERKNDRSPARWAVLNTAAFEAEGMVTSAAAIRALGLDPASIESAEFGRMTHKQDLVWLTPNITYRENEHFSPQAFADLLSDYPQASQQVTGGGLPYIQVEDLDNVLPIANAMYESGMFHFAEPSFRHRGTSNTVHAENTIEGCNPSDPLFTDQMVIDNDGPNTAISTYNYPFWAPNAFGTDVNVSDAWCVSTGNSSTIVAVFDEGVEAHKDLETSGGASRVLPGYNTDPAYSTNGGPVGDFEVHGMGIAGIIAASHDGVGIAGIAPEVQILPIHAFQDVFDDLQRADGIMWAYKNGADIIVNAWTFQSCSYYSSVIEEAVDSALTHGRGGLGTFVIFSAGYIDPNEAYCVQFPANLTQVYTLGAMGTDRGYPDYAPTGPEIDAIGISSVDSSHSFVATLDRMVLGNNFLGTPAAYLEYTDTAYTKYFGGTSTTAAEAGGIAAMILDMDASLTATQIANILSSTTRDFGLTIDPTLYGAGVIDAHAAALAAQNPVFPVTWNYFDGNLLGNQVQLTWGTLSELNADRFEVERLVENQEYIKIGEVAAEGTSTDPMEYQFLDVNPVVGENIYRLKQVDVDGNFTYSDNVKVELGESITISEPYPNPVSGTMISLKVVSPTAESISCSLLDLAGRQISTQHTELHADAQVTLSISVEDLPAGIYLLEVTDEAGIKLSNHQVVVR